MSCPYTHGRAYGASIAEGVKGDTVTRGHGLGVPSSPSRFARIGIGYSREVEMIGAKFVPTVLFLASGAPKGSRCQHILFGFNWPIEKSL